MPARLLAPPLYAPWGASTSSQDGCTSRLLFNHLKHPCSEQRELGTTVHAPFDELEPVDLPFRSDPVNKLSTTPDNLDGEHCFTITHPFHPLSGHTFPLLAQRFAWGEERVFFADPQTHEVRSLPLAWTSLALPDPFLVVAAEPTVLRLKDLQQLVQFLQAAADPP